MGEERWGRKVPRNEMERSRKGIKK